MSENPTVPALPEPAEVVEAIRLRANRLKVWRKGALIAQTPELAVQIMIAGRQRTTRFTNP